MMNADLAEVSRKHGGVGHPLRNRSASSHSGAGDGSQTRAADPSRYAKYLSLRNRKIVEDKQRLLSESSSHHTISGQTLPTAGVRFDEVKPLQPILKSSSSRVSDLRYRDGTAQSLHEQTSTESLPRLAHEVIMTNQNHQKEEHVTISNLAPVNHSPLRTKSPASTSSQSRSRNPHINGGTVSSESRSPIAVYRTEQAPQTRPPQTAISRASLESHQNRDAQGGHQRSSAAPSNRSRSRSRGRMSQFKSTTELEESEFNFDLENGDDKCSFVNTTVQSESGMSPSHRESTTDVFQGKQLSRYGQSPREDRNEGHRSGASSRKQKTSSIRDYTEDLKGQVACAETNKVIAEEDGDLSSDYDVDYEQVLREQTSGLASQVTNAPALREDIAEEPILEQTQEAIESDEDPVQAHFQLLSHRSSNQKPSYRQQDSPQFEEAKHITQRRGSKESPHIVDSRNDDYDLAQGFRKTDPIVTFENTQLTTGQSSRFPKPTASDRLDSNETTTFRPSTPSLMPTIPNDAEQFYYHRQVDHVQNHASQDRGTFDLPLAYSAGVAAESAEGTAVSEEMTSFRRNPLINEQNCDAPEEDDALTPPFNRNKTGGSNLFDLEKTNEKLRAGERHIHELYERQEQMGSNDPSGNLLVTCVIRQPMDTVGLKYKGASGGAVTREPRAFNKGAGQGRGGISNSMGPVMNRNGSLNRSTNGLELSRVSSNSGNHRSATKRRVMSNDSRSTHSASKPTRKNSTTARKAAGVGTLPNGEKYAHMLTTLQPSRFVLRSPPGLQASLLNILLRGEQDITHCQLAFDEHGLQSKQKSKHSMKVFEFDNCVGETKGHSLALGLDQDVKWVTQSTRMTAGKSNRPKNVIFLFGQADALKSQMLNVTQGNSLINQCIGAQREIRFLRVSMYHMNQEYLLGHKSFGSKQQMRREIGMEIREAFRERDLNAKKVALKLSTYQRTVRAEEVKQSSHLILQIDDLVLIDLADIDNLKDPALAKKISADFSAVTNAILSMSRFYKEQDFGRAEEDRFSPYMETNSLRSGSVGFKNQINRLVTKDSRVLLLCSVIQCSVAGTQAVDYCHKIRSYYHGSAQGQEQVAQTPTRRMQVANGDISMETEQNVGAFRQLGGLISEVSKARLFIDKVFSTKARGEPLKRSRNQLKDMVACLRDDVSDLLNSLAANNETYVHQLRKIREMLQAEIFAMREKIAAMRSVGRKGSVGGSSHKSGHALCVLPKSMFQQHASVQGNSKKASQQNLQGVALSMTNSASLNQQHNFRPQSQSSFHSANGGNNSQQNSSRLHKSKPRNQTQTWPVNTRKPSQPAPARPSHSRKSTTSKQATPVNARIPMLAGEGLTGSMMVEQPFKQQRESAFSSQKMKKSHESLSMAHERPSSGNKKSMGRKNQSATSLKGGNNPGRRLSASRSKPSRNNPHQTGSNQGQADSFNQARAVDSARINQLQHQLSEFSTNQLAIPSDSGTAGMAASGPQAAGDEFRRQTITNLNQQYDLLSGTKSTTGAIQESTPVAGGMNLADSEALHQEVYETREQLRRAIALTEEQATKRQLAEKESIRLTKELAQVQAELGRSQTTVEDLEDRIIAKDQTIRSLESQVDFYKSKVASQHATLKSESKSNLSQIESQAREYEELRQEKAQTDQMNQEILGQISQLKEALSSFQSQETLNQKMLMGQTKKDQEMQELKEQVALLMRASMGQHNLAIAQPVQTPQSPPPTDQVTLMRQQLEQLEQAKDRYRDEALHLRQQVRKQIYTHQPDESRRHAAASRSKSASKSASKGRRRSVSSNGRKESQDREPLRFHSKLSRGNSLTPQQKQQPPAQDQQSFPQRMPQQKSLNTIKTMIKDFKEQRKGLLRTTSSRDHLLGGQSIALSNKGLGKTVPVSGSSAYKRNQKTSCSREAIDDRENARNVTGYSQLNKHFR